MEMIIAFRAHNGESSQPIEGSLQHLVSSKYNNSQDLRRSISRGRWRWRRDSESDILYVDVQCLGKLQHGISR